MPAPIRITGAFQARRAATPAFRLDVSRQRKPLLRFGLGLLSTLVVLGTILAAMGFDLGVWIPHL